MKINKKNVFKKDSDDNGQSRSQKFFKGERNKQNELGHLLIFQTLLMKVGIEVPAASAPAKRKKPQANCKKRR
jgi:hypothetical protein